MDHYIVTTLLNYDVQTIFFPGKSSISFNMNNQTEVDLVHRNGLKVIRLCDEWFRLIPDLVSTMSMFADSLWQVALPKIEIPSFLYDFVNNGNVKVQQDFMPELLPKRVIKHKITPEMLRPYVKSGDIFSCRSFEGTASLIMVATGGPIDHSAIALWKGDKLYIVEASNNLIKMEFDEFINTSCVDGMIWSPLNKENREKYNADKALAWFENGIEGLPYGFSNLLQLWVDTPDKNYPLVTDEDNWIWTFSLMEKVERNITDLFMGEALNNRLGTKGLSIPEMVSKVAGMGKTLGQILAMPELDSYRYTQGISYVCSP